MDANTAREIAAELNKAARETPELPSPAPVDPLDSVSEKEKRCRLNPEAYALAAHRSLAQVGRAHQRVSPESVVRRSAACDEIGSAEEEELTGAWVGIRVLITDEEALRLGQPEGAPWPLEDE